MKYLISFSNIISLAIILSACSDSDNVLPDAPQNMSVVQQQIPDSVFVELLDTSFNVWLNISWPGTRYESELKTFENKSEKESILVIPTDSVVQLHMGLLPLYELNVVLEKGDTLEVSTRQVMFNNKEVAYPWLQIKNREVSAHELNIGYYVLANQTHPGFYDKVRKIRASGSELGNHFSELPPVEVYYRQVIEKLDSLRNKDLISMEFYELQKLDMDIFRFEQSLREIRLEQRDDPLKFSAIEVPIDLESYSHHHPYVRYVYNRLKTIYAPKSKESTAIVDLLPKIRSNEIQLTPKIQGAIIFEGLIKLMQEDPMQFLTVYESLKKDSSIRIANLGLVQKMEHDAKGDNWLKDFMDQTGKHFDLFDLAKNEHHLNQILKQNRGKVVLLDFWASWCKPCLVDIPYIKELKEIVDGQDFEVISVSLDEKWSAWEKAMDKYNLNRDQNSFLMVNPRLNPIVIKYDIKLLPRYILIDPKGEVISKIAPQPAVEGQKLLSLITDHIKNR